MNLLEIKGIKKSFDKNEVLKGIDFNVRRGEVHVLLGENGAGKSTLIKILTGVHKNDAGEIYWDGKLVEFNKPHDAMNLGISTIYQELNNVKQLKVYENIFLGREQKKRGKISFLNRDYMRKEAIRCLNELGQNGKELVDMEVGKLGMGQQQLVEIAKAIALEAKLIIMDEPTSSLSGREVEQLFKVVELLQKRRVAIIFITHKLEEIKRIGTRLTILRDGYMINTLPVKTTDPDYWIELMVGRSLDEKYPKKQFKVGKEGFRVENLLVEGASEPVSFHVNYGEIVGFSGLVGAGRTELARAIFGADPKYGGKVFIDGKEVTINSPSDAIKARIAFITEDRKNEGLQLDQSLHFNITLANMKHFANKKTRLLKLNDMKKEAADYVKELKIKTESIDINARFLSGGNQQKVVIAKWLCTKAKVFIFDEPTRGIDVGAKVEVYRLMNELVEQGNIVIMISSELPEILGICDRALVMSEGRITANIPIEKASQEVIMKYATGE
ncbi:sugar ABC transporter ATP-binding protein [Oceanobacillus zhaokaii]|uniref:sugar ABC transporter ATP-binding protein n=1 Tax=Oceanobacillus zhaokaii TaxID=2052660 RepID=UPI001FA84F0A|nr:sugar ABC transporter ATP-binding protein [Oceanobacillus zhaokaii]